MVAMSGQIMPAPLEMPVRVALRPADREAAGDQLGHRVGGHDGPCRLRPAVLVQGRQGAGRAAARRSTGRCSPMTPVEKGSTSSAGAAGSSARASQLARASARPRWPVPALALPELTSS